MKAKKINKVIAYIERGKDGSYGVYFTADLACGFFGNGVTKQEAINDFEASFEYFKNNPDKVKGNLNNIEFIYKVDIKSYLEYYTQFFTLEGISKLTKVNANQLSQYLNGFRKPSEATVLKIEKGLNNFAEDLQSIGVLL